MNVQFLKKFSTFCLGVVFDALLMSGLIAENLRLSAFIP